MTMGRPTSLTAEVQARILSALADGLYRETAARCAGICERSFYSWLTRGETGEAPYAEFLQAVKRTEAEAERAVIVEVRAGDDGWQSKAWVAERRWPKRWAARVRTAVTEELDAYTDRLAKRLDEATMKKVLDAAREDAGSEGASDPKH
jgi:hypothetical protein